MWVRYDSVGKHWSFGRDFDSHNRLLFSNKGKQRKGLIKCIPAFLRLVMLMSVHSAGIQGLIIFSIHKGKHAVHISLLRGTGYSSHRRGFCLFTQRYLGSRL